MFTIIFAFKTSWTQELSLSIIGSNEEETAVILNYDYQKKHESIDFLTTEVNKFRKKIKKEGYINNSLIEIRKINDSNHIASLALKNKIKFINLFISPEIKNENFFSKLNLKLNEKNEVVIDYNKLESQLKGLNKTITNSGYPFSSLKLTDIKDENQFTLSAKLSIETIEKERGLDKIIIKGYEGFSKSYLKHYLKIGTNKIFNIESIDKKTKAINNLAFVGQIKSPEVLFTKDSTHLYLYLEKKPSNSFDGFIGFTTNEVTNKVEFNGYLNLLLNNNLDYGETLKINYKSDESDQKNFDINVTLPYILGSPIGVEANLNILKRDSSFINTKQKASLFYQINDKNRIYTGIQSVESSNLLSTQQINTTDYKSNLYTLRYEYLKYQNEEQLFLIKSFFKAEVGIGKRNTSTINDNQSTIDIEANHIFNLNKKNSIYLKTMIQLINSDNYFENELYRFGGVNSIRGFTENSLTANNVAILNTEYRYKLSNSLFVNSVIDIAKFKNKLLNQEKNLYGFGFGFGLLTKSGLLRFIYANGKTKEERIKFANSKIHLSLTANF